MFTRVSIFVRSDRSSRVRIDLIADDELLRIVVEEGSRGVEMIEPASRMSESRCPAITFAAWGSASEPIELREAAPDRLLGRHRRKVSEDVRMFRNRSALHEDRERQPMGARFREPLHTSARPVRRCF